MAGIKYRSDEVTDSNKRWINSLLAERRITQKRLSGALGCTESAVSKFKRTGAISAERIMDICRAFDVPPPSWLKLESALCASSIAPTSLFNIFQMNDSGLLSPVDLALLESIAAHLAEVRKENQPTQRGENHE
ncbi:helix-turn-helix domain-containing protein [Spongiibacter tropicus]|uniref:helix-turn-helix domain-containing protein n=1 Tax=Spongiibacter tropicus TaxID=454602 RepID=UPI0003B48831|nr:helix-turn-helix transcriptional regulator [Spongiibacter tropicus]